MRWLLTTPAGVGRAEVERDVAPLEVIIDDAPPMPLGDEQVFQAEGPPDLPARLQETTTCVRDVHPDSDVEPYGG